MNLYTMSLKMPSKKIFSMFDIEKWAYVSDKKNYSRIVNEIDVRFEPQTIVLQLSYDIFIWTCIHALYTVKLEFLSSRLLYRYIIYLILSQMFFQLKKYYQQ